MIWPQRSRGSSRRTRLNSVWDGPPGGVIPAGGTSPRRVARASRKVWRPKKMVAPIRNASQVRPLMSWAGR